MKLRVVDAELAAASVDPEEVLRGGREPSLAVDDVALEFDPDREIIRVEDAGVDVRP